LRKEKKKSKKKEDKTEDVIEGEAIILSRKSMVLDPKKGLVWMDSQELEKKQKVSSLIEQGNAYHSSGNINSAAQCYSQALNLDPNNIVAKRNLGLIFLDVRQFEKAEQLFREILHIDPAHAPTLNSMSAMFITLQKYKQASEFVDKALAADPSNEHSINNKLNVLKALELYNELIPYAEEILSANKLTTPDKQIFACYSLMIAYRMTNKLEKAIQTGNKGLDIVKKTNLQQGLIFISYELGIIYLTQKKFSEALSIIKPAIAIAPSHPGLLDTLGDAYFNLKQYREALQCYQAIRINQPQFMQQTQEKILRTKKMLGQR